MARWLIGVVLMVGLCLTVGVFAQEGEAPEGEAPEGEAPDDEAPEGEAERGGEGQVVAQVREGNWQGEVSLKKTGQEDFEIIAPLGDEMVDIRIGDTIRTSTGGSVTVNMVDGTIIELGPDSEMVFEQTADMMIVARLIVGFADVTFGSEEFKFVFPRHEITGPGGRVVVNMPDEFNITITGVDEGSRVQNDYGLVVELGESQRMHVNYSEETELINVSIDDFNELDVTVYKEGEEPQLVPPGTSVTIDPEGTVTIGEVEPTPPPPPPFDLQIPLDIEEPEDEPYENAGDLEEIHIISPVNP